MQVRDERKKADDDYTSIRNRINLLKVSIYNNIIALRYHKLFV